MRKVRENLRIEKEDKGLLKVLDSYLQDAEHFLKTGKIIEAFEAIVIVWAYIDAGLKFGVFSIPEKFKDLFTL
ncbi:MAG: DUF357 domain-containing protein [Candidatus Aenigmarchaeota archaeon]|nr:DUF357 domain-containing protein [Candidatus Aenigmarchaeota archaeon]